MSFEVLQNKIRRLKNPTVAGLDARVEYVPQFILDKHIARHGKTRRAAAEAIYEFDCGLMDALCDLVPAVKPQAAYFEMLGWEGMEVLERVIQYAREKGFYVIADVKRGDIGTTATAYAEGWLGGVRVGDAFCPGFDADCVTLNGYMGSDAVKPFLKECRERDKALFVLVHTSNGSSVELQDMVCGDRLVYTVMGGLVGRWGGEAPEDLDKYGYNCVGAVMGATYPGDLRAMREKLPHTFFLVPGYGAQGGTAADVSYAFDRYGHGAIVNSSRGILCAWKKTGGEGEDYQAAARAAAIAMRDDIAAYTTIL